MAQGHCHQESVLKFDSEKEAFKRMGLQVEVLDAGCCGMAGSFGFSKEHYDISQAIGERALFKKIRGVPNDTIILANGFSCRTQIEQRTGRKTMHIAEVLDQWSERASISTAPTVVPEPLTSSLRPSEHAQGASS